MQKIAQDSEKAEVVVLGLVVDVAMGVHPRAVCIDLKTKGLQTGGL